MTEIQVSCHDNSNSYSEKIVWVGVWDVSSDLQRHLPKLRLPEFTIQKRAELKQGISISELPDAPLLSQNATIDIDIRTLMKDSPRVLWEGA